MRPFPRPVTVKSLEGDQRPRYPGPGAIEEETHAQRFRPFRGYQSKLPVDVIRILQALDLLLVEVRIALEPLDALLHGALKAGADLESFFHSAILQHPISSRFFERKGRICLSTAQGFTANADTSERPKLELDYDSPRLR
jgi:hypothetical protein